MRDHEHAWKLCVVLIFFQVCRAAGNAALAYLATILTAASAAVFYSEADFYGSLRTAISELLDASFNSGPPPFN